MKTLRILLAGLFALQLVLPAQALDPDRVLPALRIKPTGDVMLDSRLRIGRDQSGKFIGTPERVEIQGPGSTGDVSGMSVTAPGSGSVARALSAHFGDVFRGADYGIVCDGATDIGPPLQALAGRLGKGKANIISLPSGVCRIASPVVFNGASPILEGQGYTEGPGTGSPMGTQILIDTPGFVPFTITGANARGATVRNLAVRQIQPDLTGATWAPTNYDYVFKVLDTLGQITFDDVLFQGVTRGIYANNSGRLHIPVLRGQFYVSGVEIDNCYDIPRIGYLHAWTFSTADARVMKWQQDNLDTITLRRVDGIYLGDIFSFVARSAVRLTSGVNGVTTKAYINNLYADLTKYGIWVDAPNSSFQAANVTTQNNDYNNGATPLVGGAGLLIDTTGAFAQIGNWRTDLVESSAVKVLQSGNRVQMHSLRVAGFNSLSDGSPAVSLVTGNIFELAQPPVLVNGGSGPLVNTGGGLLQRMVGMNMPGGAVNEPRFYASPTGGAVTGFPIGPDASIDFYLGGKGPNGGLRLQANGATVMRFDNPSSGDTDVLVRPGTGALSFITESGSANASLAFAPKGTAGAIKLQANGRDVLVADNPSAGDSNLLVRSGTGGMNLSTVSATADANINLSGQGTNGGVRLNANGATPLRVDSPGAGNTTVLVRSGAGAVSAQVESSAASADLTLAAKGSGGSVRVQSNGVTVLRTDSPGPGDSNMLVRSGTGGVSFNMESGSTNAFLSLAGKGTSGVLTGVFTRTADPTTSDIPAGYCADWSNTTAATFKHVCNFAGTLRSVAMN